MNGVEWFYIINGNWDLFIVIIVESFVYLDGILKEVCGVKGVFNSEMSIILFIIEK